MTTKIVTSGNKKFLRVVGELDLSKNTSRDINKNILISINSPVKIINIKLKGEINEK